MPHETALAGLGDVRDLTGRAALAGCGVHPGDTPAAFGDPDLTVGSPGDIPRCVEASNDRLHPQSLDRCGERGVVRARQANHERDRRHDTEKETESGVHCSHGARRLRRDRFGALLPV